MPTTTLPTPPCFDINDPEARLCGECEACLALLAAEERDADDREEPFALVGADPSTASVSYHTPLAGDSR